MVVDVHSMSVICTDHNKHVISTTKFTTQCHFAAAITLVTVTEVVLTLSLYLPVPVPVLILFVVTSSRPTTASRPSNPPTLLLRLRFGFADHCARL